MITELIKAMEDTEQVAREIYYALSLMGKNSPGAANLFVALKLIGAENPESVGLSKNVLNREQ